MDDDVVVILLRPNVGLVMDSSTSIGVVKNTLVSGYKAVSEGHDSGTNVNVAFEGHLVDLWDMRRSGQVG